MSGNLASDLSEPYFLLDESLAPAVAEALALVGYRCTTVRKVFDAGGVKDPEIIAWCAANSAVWVHADDHALREHEARLFETPIRTIWVYRRDGKMTAREQLRVLCFVMPSLIDRWRSDPTNLHYRVGATSPTRKPNLDDDRRLVVGAGG